MSSITEFLQIGDRAFNLSLIESINFVPKAQLVQLIPQFQGECYELRGRDYKAFIKWWDEKAQVHQATL